MPNPRGPLRRIDEAHMVQLDDPGKLAYAEAVRRMDRNPDDGAIVGWHTVWMFGLALAVFAVVAFYG